MTRLQELMQELADTSARADIESYCVWRMKDRKRWFDTSGLDPEEQEFVNKAVEYMELRGKLERNGMRNEFVRIKP